MMPLLLTASIWTLICLALLAWQDPKSRRARRAPKRVVKAYARQLLGTACVLPGLAMVVLNAWPSLLIWLGTATLSGWLAAWLLTKNIKSIGETHHDNGMDGTERSKC